MSQRILVLGAGGFIGQHVTSSLASSDWAIPLAAGRSAGGAIGAPTQWLQLDATDESALVRALQGVDGVVNCMAGDADTMTTSARLLLNAASRLQSAPRIVHLSSIAVYGPATGLVDESAPLAGTDLYAQGKIITEQLCSAYASIVILRPGIVYGPGSSQWTARIARWLFSHRIGDLGAAGDGYCNLTYVGDLVTAIAQALRLPDVEGKLFNVAVAQPPTWNEYFIRFAQSLGAVPVTRIGRRRLQIEAKILAPPLKIAEILATRAKFRGLHLPEAIPPALLRLCRQEIRMDVAAAEKSLQLAWTGLDEGLERAALWCRQLLRR
jgi:nucleoside-diphosphate-sugar epimerase